MDAILPLFFAVLLSEIGSKTQALAHQHSLISAHGRILLVVTLTSIISYGLAAIAGLYIGELIAFDARTLLLGLALLFAGVPMVLKSRAPPELPASASTLTLIRHFATTQFGDAAQFLAFAVAARLGTPALALIGATAGILTACFIPMMMGHQWLKGSALAAVRITCALLLCGFGGWMVVSALKIV
jgi:Ca2+/H+ antiporter, TMEM165/GDT1 family